MAKAVKSLESAKGRGRRQYDDNPFGGQHKFKKDDWKELMKSSPAKLKGDEPDFSEEGWQDADQRSKYPTPTLPKGEGDLAYNIGETFDK